MLNIGSDIERITLRLWDFSLRRVESRCYVLSGKRMMETFIGNMADVQVKDNGILKIPVVIIVVDWIYSLYIIHVAIETTLYRGAVQVSVFVEHYIEKDPNIV